MQPFYQQNLSIKYTSRKCWKNKNFFLEISGEFVRSKRVLELPCQTWSWESEFLHLSTKHCDTCLLLLIQQSLYIKYSAVFRIFFLWLKQHLRKLRNPPLNSGVVARAFQMLRLMNLKSVSLFLQSVTYKYSIINAHNCKFFSSLRF